MSNGAREYGFDEISLIPNETVVDSRKDCDTSVTIGGRTFVCGVIPANMESVVNEDTCVYLAKRNWFYIMHRFGKNGEPYDSVGFVARMQAYDFFASISIGVNDESYRQLRQMKQDGLIPEYITLDIANGYAVKAERMTKFVKDSFPESFLIVGNCATAEAVDAIQGWGADMVKCGISNGHACETYKATGFGRPQFSTVLACQEVAKIPVISDGGIRDIGDISKAFVAGASLVMAGKLFAGYDQSAGEVIYIEDKRYKQYFGSASASSKRSDRNVEGKCILIPVQGNMDKLLASIVDGVQSGISYAGGQDMSAYKRVEWRVRR